MVWKCLLFLLWYIKAPRGFVLGGRYSMRLLVSLAQWAALLLGLYMPFQINMWHLRNLGDD